MMTPIDISASLFDVSARSGLYDVWLAKTDGAPAAAAWVANPPEFRSVLSTRHLLIARAEDEAAVCIARIRKNPKRGVFKAVLMTAEGVTYEGAEIDARAVGAPRIAAFDHTGLLSRYGTDWAGFWLDRDPGDAHVWNMVLVADRVGIAPARLVRVSLSVVHHLMTWLDVHDGECRAAMRTAQAIASGDPPTATRLADLRSNLVVRSVGSDKKIKAAADALLDLLTAVANNGATAQGTWSAGSVFQAKEAAERGLIKDHNGDLCDLVRAHVSLPQVTLAAMVRAEQMRAERRR